MGEEQSEAGDVVEEMHATPKKIFQLLNQVIKIHRRTSGVQISLLRLLICLEDYTTRVQMLDSATLQLNITRQ